MIQNHDLVKHKMNLQQNYPYSTYLTCVANAFCIMSLLLRLMMARRLSVSNTLTVTSVSNCCFKFQIVVSGRNPEKTTWIRAGGRDCCFKVRSSNWFYFNFFFHFSIFKCTRNIRLLPQGGTFSVNCTRLGIPDSAHFSSTRVLTFIR